MNLRELKKEVKALLNIEHNVKKFKENWPKPKLLRTNTNNHLSFLNDLHPEFKKALNKKLSSAKEDLDYIQYSQMINEKLFHYARYLIELKLTTFNDDRRKSKLITNRFLNDDFLNLKETIFQIKSFENCVKNLSEHYDDVNQLLNKNLSLDERVIFLNLPHKHYLNNLKDISQKQKTIVKELGKHFIDLVKQTRNIL